MLRKLRKKFEKIRWEDAANPSKWVQFVESQVRLYYYTARELVRNHCLQQAGALTYTTLLSLVPLLAVAFTLFRAFGSMDDFQAQATDAFFNTVFADALVEGEMAGEMADESVITELNKLATLDPAALLADAREDYVSGEHSPALLKYVAALRAGAAPGVVRSGISTLDYGTAGILSSAIRWWPEETRRAYLGAVGVPAEANPGEDSPIDATSTGLPDLSTPTDLLAGTDRLLESAETAREEGDLGRARTTLQEVLLRITDALVVSILTDDDASVSTALARHRRARGNLGEVLMRQASERVEAYTELVQDPDVSAADAHARALFEEASALVLEATGVTGDSDAAFQQRALLLRAADRHEDALKLALERQGAQSAAQGLRIGVVQYLRSIGREIDGAEIGLVGVVFLLLAATALLSAMEHTLNQLWKVKEHRRFWTRLTSYTSIIVLGPVMIGLSIWLRSAAASFIEAKVEGVWGLRDIVGGVLVAGSVVMPLVMLWFLLFITYRFLPNTRVRSRPAAWGAFLAAILLALAKPLFSIYAVNAFQGNYGRVYGQIATVPLFLLWIWLLWVIVLFGAEIAFAKQNLGLLRYHDKLSHLSDVYVDRFLAARTMMYVAREFWRDGGPVTSERLAEIMQITPEEAADTARRLVKLGLLTPVGEELEGFHPARDLSHMYLSDVLSATDRYRSDSRSESVEDRPYEDLLEKSFRNVINAQRDALGGLTFHEMLARCDDRLTAQTEHTEGVSKLPGEDDSLDNA